MDSYIGVPTSLSDGKINGIIGVMHDGAFDICNDIKDALSIMSIAIGSHIEMILSNKRQDKLKKTIEIINNLQREYLAGEGAGSVFQEVLDTLIGSSGSEYGFIGEVLTTDIGKPYIQSLAITDISWDAATTKYFQENKAAGIKFYNMDTLFGHCVTSGEIVITDDAPSHDRAGGLPKGHPALKQFLGLPLKADGRTIGMIGLANRKLGYKEIVDGFEPISHVVASILDTRRVEEKIDFLKRLHTQTVKTINKHAIVSATDIKGKIIYVNDMFCEISGYSQEELIGRDHSLLKSGEHKQQYYSEMYEMIKRGSVWQGEFHNIKKDGSSYWVYSTIQATYSPDGNKDGYIAIRTDITEQKTKAFIKAKESLEKDKFLSNVSHELRTPLNAIVGYAQLLKMDNLEKNQIEYIDEILLGGEQLIESVDSLLSFEEASFYEDGQSEIKSVVENILYDLHPQITDKNIYITTNIDDEQIIAMSEDNLKSVVSNVVENAIKYNIIGGKILIEAELTPKNFLTLKVKDSGIGILNKDLPNIFKRFNRGRNANSQYKGNGLGLSIVRELLDNCGGEILAPSDGSSWTECQLKLPIGG